jgi:tetratricopeptide (TPR) repeat protein
MNVPQKWECKDKEILAMAKKITVIFLGLCCVFFTSGSRLMAEGGGASYETTLLSGDKAFESGQFTEAMRAYETLFSEGKFSEKMLYRMAFIHENLREYPEAIYYLKKAAQEFGEKNSDAKVRQLMQRQGSTHFFAGDSWNGYLSFFRKWGFVAYIVLGLSIAGLAAHYFLPRKKMPAWRQLGVVGCYALFVLMTLVLVHRNFFVPSRAVLMERTAFYEAPAFSSNYRTQAFSLGETFDITDRQDIWIEVSAGGRSCWVPNWVVKAL